MVTRAVVGTRHLAVASVKVATVTQREAVGGVRAQEVRGFGLKCGDEVSERSRSGLDSIMNIVKIFEGLGKIIKTITLITAITQGFVWSTGHTRLDQNANILNFSIIPAEIDFRVT